LENLATFWHEADEDGRQDDGRIGTAAAGQPEGDRRQLVVGAQARDRERGSGEESSAIGQHRGR
jgi:hypothetical protein